MSLVDCGCGPGTITIGLAEILAPGQVSGVDIDASRFTSADSYVSEREVSNLRFAAGDIYSLPFAGESFDAAFGHSILETLQDPVNALKDVRRVLNPGGVIGVASVDYGGVVIAGPHSESLEQFYRIREKRWQQRGIGDPRLGRRLRSLLHSAGFTQIEASASYISYGTVDAVQKFGEARAQEYAEPELAKWAIESGVADQKLLDSLSVDWLAWAQHPDAFLAFAWCNAVGWKEGA